MIRFNKKSIEKVMKQIGMNQRSIEADRVIIERKDGRIIIENPDVSIIKISNQEFFQISGQKKEEKVKEIDDEDIKLVMEKTNSSYEKVKRVLKETNDIAEAILKLKNQSQE